MATPAPATADTDDAHTNTYPNASSRSLTPVDEAAGRSHPDPEKDTDAKDAGAPSGGSTQGTFGGLTFPDGGLKAWATVAGAWLVLFSTFGYVNAFGVYQEYYQLNYIPEKSSFDIAWIGSFQLCLQFLLSPIVGKLVDEGYIHYLIAVGTVIYSLCLQMTSLAKEYYSIFLAQGLGLGLGNGLLFLPAVSAVSHHFQKRRALATGIVTSGSSIGGICFPIMLNNLFKSTGFGWAVRASGFVVLGCLLIANALITTRLPPRKKRPAHLQVAPDVKGILRDVPYLICCSGLFFVVQGIFFPIFFLQLFATVNGINRNLAFYSLAILNGASAFGRVLPNFIADYFGALNLMIPCVAISAALMWILLAATNTAGIICYAIVFGFFSGAYISLLAPVLVGFARNLQEVGIRMGLPFAVIAIGALIGSPICGLLVGDGPDFHWWKGATYAGVMTSTGVSLLLLGRYLHAKRKGTQRV